MKYSITVDEEMLNIIVSGLEAIARAGTGQCKYALEELSLKFRRLPWKDKEKIEDYIRSFSHPELKKNASYAIHDEEHVPEKSRIAYDMLQLFKCEQANAGGYINTYSSGPYYITDKEDSFSITSTKE
jgi:hypothetical protein